MSWLLNRGLAPLYELANAASKVSVSSWTFSPPESVRLTRELSPLVIAIESVLGGLERSFAQQRRFVGDAAHELKTGVAVVKSSIQLLNMKARTQEEYEAGLNRCLADCIRMEEMVAQMLTLARVEETLSDASNDAVIEPRMHLETRRAATRNHGASQAHLRPHPHRGASAGKPHTRPYRARAIQASLLKPAD